MWVVGEATYEATYPISCRWCTQGSPTCPLQRGFGVAGLEAGHWGLVAAAGLTVFVAVEFEKAVVRWWATRQRPT